MLGWDLTVYRGATKVNKGYPSVEGGEVICYIEPTSNCGLIEPVEKAAIETVNASGYPMVYRLRAGDFPHEQLKVPRLDIPDDEIVVVTMWDQS